MRTGRPFPERTCVVDRRLPPRDPPARAVDTGFQSPVRAVQGVIESVILRGGHRVSREHHARCPQRSCATGRGLPTLALVQRELASEHLTNATTMYREMGMTYWLEQAAAETAGLR